MAVLVLAMAGVGAVNLDHRTPNERAKAWAASHANGLPATIEAFAAFPSEYQAAIFMAMPPAEKSRLWQVQLQRILDTEPNLNAEQRAFIADSMAMATPLSFSGAVPAPEVCTDITRLFPNKQVKDRFRMLGVGTTPARTWQSTFVVARERVRSAVMLHAELFPCSCRGLGICECGGDKCADGICEPAQTCGCIWAGMCDKMCQSMAGQMKVIK